MSTDVLLQEAKALQKRGVTSILLFGIPSRKDAKGAEAYAADGIVQQAVRTLKSFTQSSCHDRPLLLRIYLSWPLRHHQRNGDVDNDATLALIAKTAVAQARAGADVIAPSGMMDGMVKTIRHALDTAGFKNTLIMSYAAKYASAFYGPFREAAQSAPRFGNRHTYQMNPANAEEALREVAEDIAEGADIVMVKPALAYLDILRRVKEKFHVPVAAYNVSGEYAMVKAAGQKGWIDEKKTVKEILTGIRRAGADWIITYHARDITA